MAVTISTDVSTQLTTVKRKSSITLETPYGGNYNLIGAYETLITDANNKVIARLPSDQFVLGFAQVKDTVFNIGPSSLTGSQIAEIVSAVVDYLYQNPVAPGTTSVTIPLQ